MGMLHRDHAMANAAHTIGIVTMIAALVWAGLVVWTQLGMVQGSRRHGV
jgi:hypothetical protein